MNILSSIEEANEGDLLAVIDLRREDQSGDGVSEFNKALETLLNRHQRYIYGTIRKVLKGMPGIEPDDIYWTVVLRMIDLSGRFSSEDSHDPEQVSKKFRSWMGRIAAMVTKESLREMGTEQPASINDIEIFMQAAGVSDEQSSNLVSQVRQIIDEQLTEKEREVLHAWVLYCPLDGRQGRMDKEDLERVCKMLGTSTLNFRKLKSRALQKLRIALEPLINT